MTCARETRPSSCAFLVMTQPMSGTKRAAKATFFMSLETRRMTSVNGQNFPRGQPPSSSLLDSGPGSGPVRRRIPPEFFNHGRKLLKQVIHLGLRVVNAETEPHTAPRSRRAASHCEQYM